MHTSRVGAGCLLFWLFALLSAWSQEPPQKQIWFGELDVKVVRLRIVVYLEPNDKGDWVGRAVSLDQNNAEMNIDSVSVTSEEMKLGLSSVGATFSGRFAADHRSVKGIWAQGINKTDMTFRLVEKVPERKHVETWYGQLEAGKIFRFQIRVFQDDDQSRSAVLDSFDESLMGLSLNLIESENQFEFFVPISGAKYQGTKVADAKKIEGQWIQGGRSYPLNFESVPLDKTRTELDKRPQTPTRPYRFNSKELIIKINDEVTLSGTLGTPKTGESFPVVILVSGSGPQDRDETIYGHKLFLVLTDYLTQRGIAVFRYDERGVAKSTGRYELATTQDFADDAARIVEFLKKEPNLDPTRIGIVGHSEGGIVAPMVAASRDDIAAIVLLAGPSVTGAQVTLNQVRAMSLAAGATEAQIEANEKMIRLAFKKLGISDGTGADSSATDSNSQNPAIPSPPSPLTPSSFLGSFVQGWANSLLEKESIKTFEATYSQPWHLFFLKYDPQLSLSKVHCPTLALFGSNDLQVTTELNIGPMERALKQAGNSQFEITTLEGLNHLFQHSDTGSPSDYSRIEETVASEALAAVGDWLVKTLGVQKTAKPEPEKK